MDLWPEWHNPFIYKIKWKPDRHLFWFAEEWKKKYNSEMEIHILLCDGDGGHCGAVKDVFSVFNDNMEVKEYISCMTGPTNIILFQIGKASEKWKKKTIFYDLRNDHSI